DGPVSSSIRWESAGAFFPLARLNCAWRDERSSVFFISGLNRCLTSPVDTNSQRGHIMLRGLLNNLRQRVVRSLPLYFYHGPDSVFSKSRSAARRRQHRGIQLSLIPPILALEERIMLSGLVVTNTLDDGSTGSLRWAVGQANLNGGADTITFDAT